MEIIAKDLRKRAGSALKGFGVCQGACYKDGKLYIAFERGKGKANHAIKIARYSWPDLKCEKVSKALQLGHANGMTIKGSTLYITHSGGKAYRYLHRVDAKTLGKEKNKKIKLPKKYTKGGFSGVAYDPETKKFYLRLISSKKILVLSKAAKYEKTITVDKHWQIAGDHDVVDGKLTRTYSYYQEKSRGRVAEFNSKGTCKKTWKPGIKAEMEACFHVDGELYLVYYKKTKKKGKTRKECWIVKA